MNRFRSRILHRAAIVVGCVASVLCSRAIVHAQHLAETLLAEPRDRLLADVVTSGDARRGALVFHAAHLACLKCHVAGSGQAPLLNFVENPDILAQVAASARARSGMLFCVGFAAESHDLQAHAEAKRIKKGVPLLVGNIGPATFGQDDNSLLLVDAHGTQSLPRASKLHLARQLVAQVASRLNANRTSS